MAMVAHGHGGDNGPPDDDRPWEPPNTHKNAKGRKKGHDAKLCKKFEAGGKQKLSIAFDLHDQKTAKPIGDNGGDFTRLISNEIQRKVPFHFETWDDVDDKYKTTLWPRIHTYFDMEEHLSGPDADLFNKGMKATFKGIYRNHKNKFKDEYFVCRDGYKHPQEIRNFPPGNMSLGDWHEFCDHVTSVKHLKRSKANKANRGKQVYTSNHGSKSYAQSRHEDWNDGKGAYPDLVEQFKTKHIYKKGDKKGQWKHEAAESQYKRMLEIRKGQQGQEKQLTDKEIVTQVLGTKRGFNPGRGRVLAGSSSSSSSVCSHTAPAPQMSQSQVSALARYVMNLHEQLADCNVIDLPPPPKLDPSLFMDVDEEEDTNELASE